MPVSEARLPVDQNTPVPPAVKAASDAATAAHAAAYGATPPSLPPIPPSLVQIAEPPVPTPAPAPAPQSAPQPSVPAPEGNGSWEHRYHAMKGRFDQSQQTTGMMQQQLSEMGTELLALQQQMQQRPQPQQDNRPRPPRRMTTRDDVERYGPELLDVISRVARDTVAPDLARVGEYSQNVASRVQQTAESVMYDSLARDVPDWQAINVNPRFKAWCGLRDVYSGHIRGQMLKDAFQAADAPRVVAFFRGFLAEEQATGQLPVVPQAQPQLLAPPQPVVSLEMLAAPGRPKPAGGSDPIPAADKPIITRGQITQFYDNVRRGLYVGRDADKLRDEKFIFDCQNSGRVRG